MCRQEGGPGRKRGAQRPHAGTLCCAGVAGGLCGCGRVGGGLVAAGWRGCWRWWRGAGMSGAGGWKMATLAAVLGVIALTVWASVAAGWIKGPGGGVAGVVLTALAGVAAGYVPGIRDVVLRRRADQEGVRRAGELPGASPAGLLDPRRGLVGFTGRDDELAGLLAWCRDGAPRGVRLVTGPGGVGKTRLSVELCARLDPGRCRCVRVGDGEEGGALTVARRGWPGRVLLVVDYAETRIGLGDLLRAVAGGEGPVRVLLR